MNLPLPQQKKRMVEAPVSPTGREAPIQGYLNKLSPHSITKSTKKRWFSLHGDNLFYYASNIDPKPIGAIDMTKVEKIFRNKRESFSIVTPKREYVLFAQTEAEVIYWLNGLRKYNVVNIELEQLSRKHSPSVQSASNSSPAIARKTFSPPHSNSSPTLNTIPKPQTPPTTHIASNLVLPTPVSNHQSPLNPTSGPHSPSRPPNNNSSNVNNPSSPIRNNEKPTPRVLVSPPSNPPTSPNHHNNNNINNNNTNNNNNIKKTNPPPNVHNYNNNNANSGSNTMNNSNHMNNHNNNINANRGRGKGANFVKPDDRNKNNHYVNSRNNNSNDNDDRPLLRTNEPNLRSRSPRRPHQVTKGLKFSQKGNQIPRNSPDMSILKNKLSRLEETELKLTKMKKEHEACTKRELHLLLKCLNITVAPEIDNEILRMQEKIERLDKQIKEFTRLIEDQQNDLQNSINNKVNWEKLKHVDNRGEQVL